MSIHIDAGKDYYGQHIDLYVFDVPEFSHDEHGKRPIGIMQTPMFDTTEPGATREPSFHLSFEAAQALMDALWRCNIRPTEEGTAGQVAALEAHLQDMRRLVFSPLEDKSRTESVEAARQKTVVDTLMWQMDDLLFCGGYPLSTSAFIFTSSTEVPQVRAMTARRPAETAQCCHYCGRKYGPDQEICKGCGAAL